MEKMIVVLDTTGWSPNEFVEALETYIIDVKVISITTTTPHVTYNYPQEVA